MNTIVSELRVDHRNIARLLVYIRNSIQLICDGHADEHLPKLRNCIEYMLAYPDEIHHPKEDVLFDRLVVRESSSKESIDKLKKEHQSLADKTHELLDAIGAIESDHILPYHDLKLLGFDYIDAQFRHMRFEEDTVFPLVEQKLTLSDWKDIFRLMPTGEDPLFSETKKVHYRDLYKDIALSYQGAEKIEGS